MKVGLLFQTAEAFPGVSKKGAMTKVVFFKCYLTCAEVGIKWKKKKFKGRFSQEDLVIIQVSFQMVCGRREIGEHKCLKKK